MWMVAVIADTFHVLPSVVARDLDRDPERLSMECVPLLTYAKAKAAFDSARGDPDELKAWKDSSIMEQVKNNYWELMKARRKREKDAEQRKENA